MTLNKRFVAFSFLKSFAAVFAVFLAQGYALPQGVTDSPQIKRASVNGVDLTYQEQGRGTPVVFVHGALSDLRVWNAQREAVAPHRHFVALTQRYFGTNPWSDDGSKFSVATHGDDLAAFIRKLNAGPVELVAWSYSGPIALVAALQHPELVRSLFIYEPAALSFVTDPADAKAASEDRSALFAPAVAASKAGDSAQATRLLIGGLGLPSTGYFDTAPPRCAQCGWIMPERFSLRTPRRPHPQLLATNSGK
jgi:pimeloyl-ACP methyl ester carboxylesterase